jgi:hypothetical protein
LIFTWEAFMPTLSLDFLRLVQDIFQTIKRSRAPLLLGILALLVLSTPSQVLELYLIQALDWRSPTQQMQLALIIASLAGLCFLLGHITHALIRLDDAGMASRTVHSALTRAMPFLLGLLPAVGCAFGLYRALQSASTDILLRTSEAIASFSEDSVPAAYLAWQQHIGASQNLNDLNVFAIKRVGWLLTDIVPKTIRSLPEKALDLRAAIYVGIGACVAVGAALVLSLARRWRYSPPDESRLFRPRTLYGFVAAFVVIMALIAAQTLTTGSAGSAGYALTSLPRSVGTLTLLNLGLIFLVLFCSFLTRWADKTRIPLLSSLTALALLLSYFNFNDNHRVRVVPPERASHTERASLGDAFDAWMASRPADYRQKFSGKPYPVYVVAAQGGGIYAANLAGLTLARIYDRCPAIRHHLFAVSGVSGGSIGAGYLAALLNDPTMTPQDDTCALNGDKGPIEVKMEALLRADLLAPVAAGFLFPDLLQRLLPVPVAAFDRARAFEAGIETAWHSAMKSSSNPLVMPFRDHWRPSGAAPMLFLNATIVETGQQVAIAPVRVDSDIVALQRVQAELARPGFDVPLSTAMSLSARFPLITPAGRVALSHREVRLADGGYFENSGTETAVSIIERLRAHLCEGLPRDFSNCQPKPDKTQAYAFRLVALTDYDPLADALRDPKVEVSGLNELLAPVQTMFNARVARGEVIVSRLLAPQHAVRTVPVSLNPQLYHLPLGWHLSAQAQSMISAQIGEPYTCRLGADSPGYSRAYQIASEVDQGLRLIANGSAGASHDRTPFVRMLRTLRGNQCGMMDALTADGVGPRKPQCHDLVQAVGRDRSMARARRQADDAWIAAATQQHGQAFADLNSALDVVHSCDTEGQNTFVCFIEAAPCGG